MFLSDTFQNLFKKQTIVFTMFQYTNFKNYSLDRFKTDTWETCNLHLITQMCADLDAGNFLTLVYMKT